MTSLRDWCGEPTKFEAVNTMVLEDGQLGALVESIDTGNNTGHPKEDGADQIR